MSKLLTLLILFLSFSVFSQNVQSDCAERNGIPENQYHGDPIEFTNGAKLFWQWNCDKAWLTFENKEKIILQICEESNVYSCQRTGLDFLKEYSDYLLFQYKWISGCCTPPDLIFLGKDSGKELRRIKNDLFVHGSIEDDFVLYFSDTTYTELIFLNHLTGKKYSIDFTVGQVLISMAENNALELHDLFTNYETEPQSFTFDFKTRSGSWNRMIIEIE